MKIKYVTQTKNNDTKDSSKEYLKIEGFPNEEIKAILPKNDLKNYQKSLGHSETTQNKNNC